MQLLWILGQSKSGVSNEGCSLSRHKFGTTLGDAFKHQIQFIKGVHAELVGVGYASKGRTNPLPNWALA
jgi:hypothetical protein